MAIFDEPTLGRGGDGGDCSGASFTTPVGPMDDLIEEASRSSLYDAMLHDGAGEEIDSFLRALVEVEEQEGEEKETKENGDPGCWKF